MSNQPRRHGHDWPGANSPAVVGRQAKGPAGPTQTAKTDQGPRIVPVKQVQSWLSQLSPEHITYFSRTFEVRYDHTLTAGQSLAIGSIAVDNDTKLVLNDIDFQVLIPGSGLAQPNEGLPADAVSGILRFELKFPGASRLDNLATQLPAYDTTAAASVGSGWSRLDKPFGPERMATFAIYAGATEVVELSAFVVDPPRFQIAKVSATVRGFKASERAVLQALRGA